MAGASRTSPQPLPRGLILAASIWLVASWVIAIGLRSPVQPSAASYTPGVRIMLLCVVIGLMIGWPLLRLSQRATFQPVRQTMLDLVVLLALSQVVVWPLRLVTPWTTERTAAMDATLCGWALLAGAIVASAVGSIRGGVRNLAMLACLCMCMLGPAAAWMGVVTGVDAMQLIGLSPLMAINTLSDGGPAPLNVQTWHWIGVLGAADVAAWTALFIVAWWRNRRNTLARIDVAR